MTENNLAIANIPIQQWGGLYNQEEALNIGTIFHDLNKPFFCSRSCYGKQESHCTRGRKSGKIKYTN